MRIMARQFACSGHNYEHNSFGTVCGTGIFVHLGGGGGERENCRIRRYFQL